MRPPRILVIDDLFGRTTIEGPNEDRENLCAHFRWRDDTRDASARASRQKVRDPIAQVVFFRGQFPRCATVGDVVENDPKGALDAVRRGWYGGEGDVSWSMLLLDLCFYTGLVTPESDRQASGMPEGSPEDDDPRHYFGLTLLDAVRREFPDLPVFILSSKPREEVSLEYSRRGAQGFVARDDLRGPEILKEALWLHGLLPSSEEEIVADSLAMRIALREARRAARHREPILIEGERGSGKETVARYLNRASSEGPRPFVTINSATITTSVVAAELFGIESRTGGAPEKLGLLESGQGGDVFLDEIGDMPPKVQAAILRVLEDGQMTRMGGSRPISLEVRFLSATNGGLEGVRPELVDRLRSGGTLRVPPLRERKDDILPLAERYILEAERSFPNAVHRTIAPETEAALFAYVWPGNVRELRTTIIDAVRRAPDVEHLVPAHLLLSAPQRPADADRAPPPTTGGRGIAAFLAALDELAFDPNAPGEWAGRLGDIQRAQARLVARYLQASLAATRKRTPQHPDGTIQIHPAVKLMTGDAKLTASKAADLIKRILAPVADELEGDLRCALDTAWRLRPGSPSKERSPL